LIGYTGEEDGVVATFNFVAKPIKFFRPPFRRLDLVCLMYNGDKFSGIINFGNVVLYYSITCLIAL
jgi:hypothetical protein